MLSPPNYGRVKREVAAIHQQFDIVSPPVNPVEIAQHYGVKVYFARFSGEQANVAGFYDCDEDAIYVNRDEFPLRQTFTIAHELGHRILHAEWARSSDYKVLMRDGDYTGNEPHEKEANAFAAHFLVSRFMLDQYWPSLNVNALSKLFAVSVPMIRNRLSIEYGV